jgi:hypothetical protein
MDTSFKQLCEVAHAHARILDNTECALHRLSGDNGDLRTAIADILRDISVDRAELLELVPTLDDLRASVLVERVFDIVSDMSTNAQVAQHICVKFRSEYLAEPRAGLIDRRHLDQAQVALEITTKTALDAQNVVAELRQMIFGLGPETI